jgi:hypothetical protein
MTPDTNKHIYIQEKEVDSLLFRWRSLQRDRFVAGSPQRDKFKAACSISSGIGSPGSSTKLTSVNLARDVAMNLSLSQIARRQWNSALMQNSPQQITQNL